MALWNNDLLVFRRLFKIKSYFLSTFHGLFEYSFAQDNIYGMWHLETYVFFCCLSGSGATKVASDVDETLPLENPGEAIQAARSKHDNLEIVSMNNKGPHVFHTTSLLWPRNYPPRFGLRLVDLWHRLSSEKYGMPPLPKEVPPDHVSYSSMSFEDLWSDAPHGFSVSLVTGRNGIWTFPRISVTICRESFRLHMAIFWEYVSTKTNYLDLCSFWTKTTRNLRNRVITRNCP